MDDDLFLLLFYSQCGKDTYILTNDQLRDHFDWLTSQNCPVSKNRLYSLIKARTLNYSRASNVVEVSFFNTFNVTNIVKF